MDESNELYIISYDFNNPSKIYKFQPVPTSVEESNKIPKTFSLLQNYPNPFNPSTTITFQLENTTDYELAIYDMTGKQVRLLEQGNKGPGVYTAIWNGQNDKRKLVGSGVYVIRLKSGNRQMSRKATLLK